jgi:DNA-binding PadR family transcriptional regulator
MISIMKEPEQISTLSLAILGLVSQQPRSGYDIRKMFSSTPMGHFSASPGAIYPALKRLEKCEWIQGQRQNSETLRPKLEYSLTPAGRQNLEKYVSQPITPEDVIWRMDELMLRFAFMENIVGLPTTFQFLQQFLAQVEAYVCTLQEFRREFPEESSLTGRLALENGIEGYQANARWARRAIAELKQKISIEE